MQFVYKRKREKDLLLFLHLLQKTYNSKLVNPMLKNHPSSHDTLFLANKKRGEGGRERHDLLP